MWRFAICALVACKGDAPPAPPQPGRIPVLSASQPAFVAVRDDAGTTWQMLAPRDGGYDVPITARFSLLVVCASWMGSEVELRHWTADDALDFVIACEGFDGESLSDVTPVFAAGDVIQTVKSGGTTEVCGSNTNVCSLRTGIHDTMLLHAPDSDAVRAKLVRGVSIFDGARIDADASRGWQPERRTIEIVSTVPSRAGAVYVCLETGNGDSLLCSGKTYTGAFPERVEQSYLRVPDAHRLPADCDMLDAPHTRICMRDAPHTRVEIAPREVAMHVDGRALAFTLGDADALSIDVRGAVRRGAQWHIVATKRWLAGATSYTPPDVSIAGWRAEWSLAAEPSIVGALVWGPKPSAHRRRSPLSQRLAPGDRIDTRFAP